MEELNIYYPDSASFVSEPYGLSNFHKWVIPQIIKDCEGEFSPIEATIEEINKLNTILSESKYMDEDKEFLNTKYQEWKDVYLPKPTDESIIVPSTDNIYQIVPKEFKKSIYK